MNIEFVTPPKVGGYVRVNLDNQCKDFLWKVTRKGWKSFNAKPRLAGNISHSYDLIDEDNFFFNTVLADCIDKYKEMTGEHIMFPDLNGVVQNISSKDFELSSFWSNYQYKHEFNPFHLHDGIYSFAIWLQIPYNWEGQTQLPLFNGTKKNDVMAGNFVFEFTDMFGRILAETFRLGPYSEGTMVFFPARLRHAVYPFYNTDQPRISISGNITLKK